MKRYIIIVLALFSLCIFADTTKNAIFTSMKVEMERSLKGLILESEILPYFISYTVEDIYTKTSAFSMGSITSKNENRRRTLYSNVRVGDYSSDDSIFKHSGGYVSSEDYRYSYFQLSLPLENDILGMRKQIWLLTDSEYKNAIKNYFNKKQSVELTFKKEDIPDFTKRDAKEYSEDEIKLNEDTSKMEALLLKLSNRFNKAKSINNSQLKLDVKKQNTYHSNSEGTILNHGKSEIKISISADTIDKDGMPFGSGISYYVHSMDELPSERSMAKDIDDLIKVMDDSHKAELLENYFGPVLIEAPASGRFLFNLILRNFRGERVEYENTGLNYYNYIGMRLLPKSVNIYADSSVKKYNEDALAGYFAFDDEGVRPQKILLVENGLFKNFIVTRTPIKGFLESNGYAKRGWRNQVKPEFGNVFFECSDKVTFEDMKKIFIEMCEDQNIPFGLIIKGIGGQARSSANPVLIYKYDIKTGKETMVKGLRWGDMPAISIARRLIFSNDEKVSSFDDISVVSPSILIEEIELKALGTSVLRRPPIIPAP